MMINNNTDSVNFNGCFRLRRVSSDIQERFNRILPETERKCFNSIRENGDIVILSPKYYDIKVKNFIKKNNLQFEYYPTIGYDKKMTMGKIRHLITRIVSNKEQIINKIPVLEFHLLSNNPNVAIQRKHIGKVLNTLRLNVEKPTFSVEQNGAMKIRDQVKSRTLYVSPFYKGSTYVYVKPDSLSESSSRYLLGSNGTRLIKEFSSPNEIKHFNMISGIFE